MKGKLFLVGIGPGSLEHLTIRAQRAIEEAETIIGYGTYIELIRGLLKGKRVICMGMGEELLRARTAIDMAYEGGKVALISGGDIGIYGMAGPVFEILKERGWVPGDEIEMEVIPGVAAFSACAAILGAPLMHDFCVISLSDLLTPWEIIAQRIEAASKADLVIVFYNPKSSQRKNQLIQAHSILMKYRPPDTPVGIVKNCLREGERVVLTSLKEMLEHEVDMSTTIIIGNSQTFQYQNFMVTPRGYSQKYQLKDFAPPDKKSWGKLYGIGVGPGDPQYLTVKGVEILKKVKHIFYPLSGAESLALRAIEPYIRKEVETHPLYFPMIKDEGELKRHWYQSAEKIISVLLQGEDAAFITLGDPTIYSTYTRLLKTIKSLEPQIEVETVPGISSFTAAACLENIALVEGEERMALIAVGESVSIEDALDSFDTIVLFKVSSRLPQILEILERKGIKQAILFSDIGTPNQRIEKDLKNLKAGYMSLMIVKRG